MSIENDLKERIEQLENELRLKTDINKHYRVQLKEAKAKIDHYEAQHGVTDPPGFNQLMHHDGVHPVYHGNTQTAYEQREREERLRKPKEQTTLQGDFSSNQRETAEKFLDGKQETQHDDGTYQWAGGLKQGLLDSNLATEEKNELLQLVDVAHRCRVEPEYRAEQLRIQQEGAETPAGATEQQEHKNDLFCAITSSNMSVLDKLNLTGLAQGKHLYPSSHELRSETDKIDVISQMTKIEQDAGQKRVEDRMAEIVQKEELKEEQEI